MALIFEKAKEKDDLTYYIVATITYILSIRRYIDVKDAYEEANKISIEGGEIVMTAAEKLIQEGEQRNAVETAKKLLLMGDSVTKIAIVTGLSEKEVEDIKKKLDKK